MAKKKKAPPKKKKLRKPTKATSLRKAVTIKPRGEEPPFKLTRRQGGLRRRAKHCCERP